MDSNSLEDEPNDADKSCPVCYDSPELVFSCQECDNWVCGPCKSQLMRCPTCRQDFLARPPRRNRAVERLLQRLSL